MLKLPGIDFRCVELDDEKVAWLSQTYPGVAPLIIHGDILEIKRPFENSFMIVGNFPYNISSQILFRILEWKDAVIGTVGMFQKEVAQRVAASHGSKVYGVTSVLVQAYFEVDYLFEVPESAFNPPPKVKSAVIALRPRKDKLHLKSERSLFVLVKTAFNQRRKTMRNAVRSIF